MVLQAKRNLRVEVLFSIMLTLQEGANAVETLMRSDYMTCKAIFNYARGAYPKFFEGYHINEKYFHDQGDELRRVILRVKKLLLCDLTAFKAVYCYSKSAWPSFFEGVERRG